ncbi:MAG: hypothetical protein ACSHX8_15470 [Opitutaceae bacterium]
MNKCVYILLIIAGVALPLVFIGSAYFVIPNFIEIYGVMFGSMALPSLTERIIEVPLWSWLVVSALLAILNVFNIAKVKSPGLAALSAGIMIMISAMIVVGIFLPISGTIKQLHDGPDKSQPVNTDTVDNSPVNSKH